MENKKTIEKLLFVDSLKVITFLFEQYPNAEIPEKEALRAFELAFEINTIFRKNEVKKEVEK